MKKLKGTFCHTDFTEDENGYDEYTNANYDEVLADVKKLALEERIDKEIWVRIGIVRFKGITKFEPDANFKSLTTNPKGKTK